MPLSPVTVGPYKYDAAGNIIHMGSDRYTYDELSRIISGTAVTRQNADTQQFEYDGFGNLRKVTVPNKSILYIDADPATNKLKDTAGLETGTNVLHMWGGGYDAAGNQQAANSTPSYDYDSMNMMSEMSAPRHEMYIYDANDERVATVGYTDAQNTVWRYTLRDEGNHVLRTVTDTVLAGAHSWQQTEDYVYRTGGLLAAVAPQGSAEARKHFHLDHLGSAVLITDDNGQQVASHKYWPFGVDAPGSDVDSERMKFTGHERDLGVFDSNGLDYMHARYYNALAGRFLSVDPAWSSSDLTLPETLNQFGYARNNPAKYIDPDGKIVIADDIAIGLFIGTALLAEVVIQAPSASNHGQTNGQAWAASISEGINDGKRNVQSWAASISAGIDSISTGLISLTKEHDKGARPSTEEKHAKGKERKIRDAGGEKADWKPDGTGGNRRPPNKRPNWWPKTGPWPPKSVVPSPPTKTKVDPSPTSHKQPTPQQGGTTERPIG